MSNYEIIFALCSFIQFFKQVCMPILWLYVVIPIFKAIRGLILLSVIPTDSFLFFFFFALFPFVFCDAANSHHLELVTVTWNWDKHVFFQREFGFTSVRDLGTVKLGLPFTFLNLRFSSPSPRTIDLPCSQLVVTDCQRKYFSI